MGGGGGAGGGAAITEWLACCTPERAVRVQAPAILIGNYLNWLWSTSSVCDNKKDREVVSRR